MARKKRSTKKANPSDDFPCATKTIDVRGKPVDIRELSGEQIFLYLESIKEAGEDNFGLDQMAKLVQLTVVDNVGKPRYEGCTLEDIKTRMSAFALIRIANTAAELNGINDAGHTQAAKD